MASEDARCHRGLLYIDAASDVDSVSRAQLRKKRKGQPPLSRGACALGSVHHRAYNYAIVGSCVLCHPGRTVSPRPRILSDGTAAHPHFKYESRGHAAPAQAAFAQIFYQLRHFIPAADGRADNRFVRQRACAYRYQHRRLGDLDVRSWCCKCARISSTIR